jgi:hypothetical protein
LSESDKALRRRKPRSPRVKPAAPAKSGVESVVLPERSVHLSGYERPFRARRSSGRLPALVEPIDIPEDAAGRVAFIVTPHVEDRDEPEPALLSAASPARSGRLGSGWPAVAGVGAVLIAVFLLGVLLLR